MLQHVNHVCTARAGSQWDGTEEHQRRLDAEDVPFNRRAHRELREDKDVEARTQLPTVVMLPQSTTLQHPYLQFTVYTKAYTAGANATERYSRRAR
jgi:hypothetical protein